MLKFSYFGENKESFISNFLMEKKFEQISINSLLYVTESKLLVIEKKTSVAKIQEIANLFNKTKNTITIFLIHKIKKEIKLNNHIICIFYPIKINDFEKILNKKINNPKISFNDILLDKRGLIINKNNNHKTYLTEAEQNILKFLIFKQEVSKKELKKEILNLNPLVDTRSLESHLSRIRKKIQKIDSVIKIISVGLDNILII